LGQGGAGEEWWEEGMPRCPFIGLEAERGGRVTKGNWRRRWRRPFQEGIGRGGGGECWGGALAIWE
jgi:hypothetical protein